MEIGVQTSPTYSTDSGLAADAALGSSSSPSSRRSSGEVAGSPPSPWDLFDYGTDNNLADYIMSGETSDVMAPIEDDSLSTAPSDDCRSPDNTMSRAKVPIRKTRGERRCGRSTRKNVRYNEDSVSRPLVACDNEAEYVAVETSAAPTAPSGSGRPSVKIVKVIKPRDTADATADVLKAIDEKNHKNALLARSNRAKKKKYMEDLENQVEELNQTVASLQKDVDEKSATIQELQEEREYLKSVIMNSSALAGLLQNIKGVELRSNLGSHKRASEAVCDHDYTSPPKKLQRPSAARGVCLHVTPDHVSLEFCPKCAEKSAQVD